MSTASLYKYIQIFEFEFVFEIWIPACEEGGAELSGGAPLVQRVVQHPHGQAKLERPAQECQMDGQMLKEDGLFQETQMQSTVLGLDWEKTK